MPTPGDMQGDNDLELAFDLAPVGLCVTRQRVIHRCNDTFSDMFGLPRAELQGSTIERLYPSHEEYEHIGAHGLQLMRKSGRYSDERIMRHANGRLFWCHVAGRSMSLEHPFACAVWMFEDISQRRSVTASLTVREREIVRQLALGHSTKQAARILKVSPRTIDGHRARIMKKLGAKSASEMMARLVGLS